MQAYHTSPWIPAEWIAAHGLEPRGLWFAPDLHASPPLQRDGLCPFSATVSAFAQRHADSLVVSSTHCDQLRRGFDDLQRKDNAFLFNLPATWQSPAAEQLLVSELKRLSLFLIGHGAKAPSPEAIATTFEHYRQARLRLQQAAAALSGQAQAEMLTRFYWDGSVEIPSSSPPPPVAQPLALLGGPLLRSQWDLFRLLERAGAQIVLNATETGERPLAVANQAPSRSLPMLGLARACLLGCTGVFQRPNSHLYSWLAQQLAARRVKGIILWQYLACDLWRAEAQSLRETFKLPLLPLDVTDLSTLSARSRGRLEAFLESLS